MPTPEKRHAPVGTDPEPALSEGRRPESNGSVRRAHAGNRDRHPEPKPLILGVTGNIATGKSTVTGILAELGAVVIDSDLVYRDLVSPGQPLLQKLATRFGDDVIAEDGSLNRKALGAIVFNDPAALADLDRLTHPAVRAEVDRRIKTIRAEGTTRHIVLDAVKLIESGGADRCDAVWVVIAKPAQQVERLMARNKLSRDDAEARVAAQPPLEPKLARADLVIDNSDTFARTRERVMQSWEALMTRHDLRKEQPAE